jgi:hypothetical protein
MIMGALDRMWENRPSNNGNYNDENWVPPPEPSEPSPAPPPDTSNDKANNSNSDG